jgi:hypothetical protein
MIPERLDRSINSVVPSGVTHIGFVATNVFGEVLVTEPNGHPHGVSATFNKLKLQPNEQPAQALTRCLREQIGQKTEGVFPIPVVWATSQSTGFYFAGMLRNQSESPLSQTQRTMWCDRSEAERRIGGSQNAESKRRDLCLLAAVSNMCLSPYRRILLMLRELHKLGFERLRAPAYEYPLAWRCPILPAYWTYQWHGGRFDHPFSQIEHWFGVQPHQYEYSAADRQFPFGWEDVAFDTPLELAKRFIRDRREIACLGWGPDSSYVQWFQEVLDATKPNGLYSAFGEDKELPGRLYTLMTRVESVPLPPPGWAKEGEFTNHCRDGLEGDLKEESA